MPVARYDPAASRTWIRRSVARPGDLDRDDLDREADVLGRQRDREAMVDRRPDPPRRTQVARLVRAQDDGTRRSARRQSFAVRRTDASHRDAAKLGGRARLESGAMPLATGARQHAATAAGAAAWPSRPSGRRAPTAVSDEHSRRRAGPARRSIAAGCARRSRRPATTRTCSRWPRAADRSRPQRRERPSGCAAPSRSARTMSSAAGDAVVERAPRLRDDRSRSGPDRAARRARAPGVVAKSGSTAARRPSS